jgi:SAM-dependent methyltransferase
MGAETDADQKSEFAASLSARLAIFLAGVDRDRAAEALVAREGFARGEARRTVDTFIGEAAFGLGLIAGGIQRRTRILEVGCGAGLILRFLRAEGFDAYGLEPSESGFGFMRALIDALAKSASEDSGAELFPISASDLARERHGAFDLIYSVNVIEHVDDLGEAFAGMARVLAPQGVMVHHCPNYFIPYEPHLGIPLAPFAPRATAAIFRRKIAARRDLWDGLNFVTAADLRRIARRENLVVEFERGVLASSLRRLKTDAVFAARHPAARFAARLAPALALAPAEFSTPMTARFRRADAAAPHPAR